MRRPVALLALALCGCPGGEQGAPTRQVVVYCALDRGFAQPVLDEFQRETGIEVLPKWDAEATKTVGLVKAIQAERDRPRCDLFWNNEVAHTVLLADEGLLQPHASPNASAIPAEAKDPRGLWTGFAARARVLIVNTDLVPEADRPRGIAALADPRWKGRCGIAKPLFGTTSTHVAAMFARDPAAAKAWLDAIKRNDVVVCAGNASVKDRVASGELAFGLTDTDDVNLAVLDRRPVAVVFPDQAEGEMGTLMIPNSLAIVAGAPHLAEARQLVDWLLRPEVEARLAASRSAQVPLRPGIARAPWIPASVRTIPVTWADVGRATPDATEHVRTLFP